MHGCQSRKGKPQSTMEISSILLWLTASDLAAAAAVSIDMVPVLHVTCKLGLINMRTPTRGGRIPALVPGNRAQMSSLHITPFGILVFTQTKGLFHPLPRRSVCYDFGSVVITSRRFVAPTTKLYWLKERSLTQPLTVSILWTVPFYWKTLSIHIRRPQAAIDAEC